MRMLLIIFFALLIACPSEGILAMSSANYAIPTDSIEGGGGDTSASADYKLNDSIGQAATGSASSASFEAQQGYRATTTNSVLSVAFVDNNGTPIASPMVAFSDISAGSTTSGQLSTASSRLRVINTRTVAPWSMTIAATAGPSANWNDGTDTMSFNRPGSALTVDPAAGTVAAVSAPCTTTGLTLEPAATFNQGVVDSITLLTAGAGADTGCAWDMTGAALTQTVPTNQPAGSYSLSMTITVS
jgi:hypothetical protein